MRMLFIGSQSRCDADTKNNLCTRKGEREEKLNNYDFVLLFILVIYVSFYNSFCEFWGIIVVFVQFVVCAV